MNFLNLTFEQHRNQSAPAIQKILNEHFCEIIKNDDPFAYEKALSNQTALLLYRQWKPKTVDAVDPFTLALRLALAGNIMDYGANIEINIQQTIQKALNTKLAIDHTAWLTRALKKANTVLYLGDNAGEIVFDKLFIETLMHPNLIYVVKGAPVLNDSTLSDAFEINMEEVADVITNGDDAPSTLLENCSKEFIEAYRNADLIIAKGQGNFEGLMHQNDSRLFFLLMAKCDVIAELFNVPKGSLVVYNPTFYRHGTN
ncbi:MAG: DUF89 domain-containing protein [Salinivirgaceae bacterium]